MVLSALRKMRAVGLKIEVINGRLRVTPASQITPAIAAEIKRCKADILAELSGAGLATCSVDSKRLRRSWCESYGHRYGWRGFYDETRCLTCCQPYLPDPVAAILEEVDGQVVAHDPWRLPDDDHTKTFIQQQAEAWRNCDWVFRGGVDAAKLAMLDWWRLQADVPSRP